MTDDIITLKVYEHSRDKWCYAVYYGDGSKPGSLKAAGGGYKTEDVERCMKEGWEALQRQIIIRDCDHELEQWRDSDLSYCIKCGIIPGLSLADDTCDS